MVVEFEGVVVEDTSDLHTKAWMQLADAEGKPRPLQFALKRAEGMKNEQVCVALTQHALLHITGVGSFLLGWCTPVVQRC